MRHHTILRLVPLLSAAAAALACGGAAAADPPADPHAHHHMMMLENKALRRSEQAYKVPDLQLVRDDGKSVVLSRELADDRMVVLNFIYTTCTTICPVTSQVFSLLQEKLGAGRSRVHLVSISIDPEQDTPARLREYAKRYHAGPGWQHYTGTVQASMVAQQAFGVYRGDKMNHQPVTLLRAAPGAPWVRLDGFASVDDLLAEVHAASPTVAAR
jgi:protein SCO1